MGSRADSPIGGGIFAATAKLLNTKAKRKRSERLPKPFLFDSIESTIKSFMISALSKQLD
jgi:hypothetical protein